MSAKNYQITNRHNTNRKAINRYNNQFVKKPLACILAIIMSSQVMAQVDVQKNEPTKVATTKNNKQNTNDVLDLGTVTIVGNSKKERMKNVGSAHSVDEDAIADFDATDVHSVLDSVPGVYSRGEDGYGLRPNIALRGVRAERSQNVTIMEDGILITPAPYSAPAAYYFPNVARMKKVEVFKGPSAIKYGPRTVGGAINFVSQPTATQGETAKVSASYGSDNQYKLYGKYGNSFDDDQFAYTIEGLLYGADGFLDIDSSDKHTGFDRKDVNAKIGWYPESEGDIDHMLIAKVGYADEASNSTYLGVSDADHKASPYTRYSASQNDHFDSKHYQAHIQHFLYLPDDWTIESKAYYNQFEREWTKVDGFANTKGSLFGGAKVSETLKHPEQNSVFYNLLTGRVNTSNLDVPYLNLGIDLTNNARQYDSYGVDVQVQKTLDWLGGQHEFEAGVRLHKDSIDRNHQAKGYAMENKQLIYNGFSGDKLVNRGESDAVSAFIMDTATFNKLRVTAGLRSENITSTLTEKVHNFQTTNSTYTNTENGIMPGAGAYYQVSPEWGVLAGAHGGFSPSGPGREGSTADSETSTNYEAGVRFASDKASINAELIGFYSDYNNVIGRARASNGSAQVCSTFNSGAVNIYGAEFALDMEFTEDFYTFPVKLAYTYTDSEFENGFNTSFKEWGNVNAGDELPYIPRHKARLQFGAKLKDEWQAMASVNYTGKMREVAGSGDYKAGETINASTMVDLSAKKYMSDKWSIGLNVQNVLDNQSIASRRPFGARPVKPRAFILSTTYEY